MAGSGAAVGGRSIAGVLLDIEGVLLTSSTALPGAARAVEDLRRLDVPVRFVTNTTSAPSTRIAATLVQAGIDVLAAQTLGMVGVQVRTGKFRQQQIDRSPNAPDHVIDSIADLIALLDV